MTDNINIQDIDNYKDRLTEERIVRYDYAKMMKSKKTIICSEDKE